jgi:hypothetical protein
MSNTDDSLNRKVQLADKNLEPVQLLYTRNLFGSEPIENGPGGWLSSLLVGIANRKFNHRLDR